MKAQKLNKGKDGEAFCISLIQGAFFVRARPGFGYGVFRVPKNEIPETNKPPAMRVVGIALAYSKKPPMVQ